jgi:hypothetical protein
VVSNKKISKISTNQNTLWALAAMLDFRSAPKTKIFETKLPRNDHWKVLYKVYVFYADRKFKLAAMTRLSLTLDPMGKMFQNASSLKPLGELKSNCPGMIIGIHVQFGFNNICSF